MASTSCSCRTIDCPVPLVCPACRGELIPLSGGIFCSGCGHIYPFNQEFPDLIVGGRFDDAEPEEQMLYEEQCNIDTTRNYWLPRFHALFAGGKSRPKLLSLGCGTGTDVDLITDAGFTCVGIDNGNRSRSWLRRQHRDHLVLANGKHLPFPDESFDGAFCGCVFPHVGVIGDSARVAADYFQQRLDFATEMSRVLKPGGKILVSSPNRLFPADIFHGRKAGSYKPRPNSPSDPFLLSVADYRRLFQAAGCTSARPQPVAGYWGFIRSKHSLKGRLLGAPFRTLFRAVSVPGLEFLAGSPLSPWIVVLVEKPV